MRIDLPLAVEPEPEAEPDTGTKPEATGHGGTVLLCDDNRNVLEVLAEMTKHLGYNVLTTTDPRECVSLYRSLRDGIDVVIVDQIMPEQTGDAVIGELREFDPDARTIWLSGYRPKESATATPPGSQATVRLSKPVDLQQLQAALSAAMRQQ